MTLPTQAPANHRFNSPALQEWFDRGRQQTVGKRSIFVIDEGAKNAPVLLFIHGFPTSSYDWQAIWPSLVTQYRVISLDMLGFGFSDKPNKRTYTIHQQADLFDSTIKQFKLSEFHIIAHDYGVSVAQELLARQFAGDGQGRCLSCCFLNGGLFPETHQALLIQKILLSRIGKLVNAFTGFSLFSASFSKVFGEHSKPSKQELRDFWEVINYAKGKHVFHNLITYMLDRQEHRERWVSALQISPIPLALINGSMDPVSGQHLVTRYKELACRLDYLCELPAIGHYPQVEAPNAVSNALLEFLELSLHYQ